MNSKSLFTTVFKNFQWALEMRSIVDVIQEPIIYLLAQVGKYPTKHSSSCSRNPALLEITLATYSTVIKYLKNLGYCPTMYIMFEAIIALLSFPRLISHKPRRSYKRYTFLDQSVYIVLPYELIKL